MTFDGFQSSIQNYTSNDSDLVPFRVNEIFYPFPSPHIPSWGNTIFYPTIIYLYEIRKYARCFHQLFQTSWKIKWEIIEWNTGQTRASTEEPTSCFTHISQPYLYTVQEKTRLKRDENKKIYVLLEQQKLVRDRPENPGKSTESITFTMPETKAISLTICQICSKSATVRNFTIFYTILTITKLMINSSKKYKNKFANAVQKFQLFTLISRLKLWGQTEEYK